MAGAENYTVARWVVPANEVITIPAVGSFIACLESTLADFLIAIDADAPQYLAQGLTVEMQQGETFEQFTVDNSANASPLTVRLAWGTGAVRDARFSSSAPLSIAKPTSLQSINDATVGAAASATILVANTSRREAFITNLSTTVTVRVADGPVGATRGIPLLPLATLIIETTSRIDVFNPGAGSVLIAGIFTED